MITSWPPNTSALSHCAVDSSCTCSDLSMQRLGHDEVVQAETDHVHGDLQVDLVPTSITDEDIELVQDNISTTRMDLTSRY